MKYKIKTKLVIFIVLAWSISLIFALVSAKNTSETKEGKLVIKEPLKNGSFFIASNLSPKGAGQNEINSPVLKADFPFNALYIQWAYQDNTQNTDFELYVRFLNENWSDWLKMAKDDDYQGKDTADAKLSSQLIPTKLTDSFQYKLIFNSDQAKSNLQNLEFIYLDATQGPKGIYKISTQNNDLPVIIRQQWGADDSLRYDQIGADLWPEEYYTPKKFVIHHTAGEKANENPMAYLRAIQYYHAKDRGWGDIGYNYLIDSQGNIYEGRKGGDGVVAGHAYLRNRNTIGIAILGCYDNQDNQKKNSTCNTPTQLTEETKIALNKLIAAKSREFNIDPLAESEFHGQILPNVIGHKDVGNTTCPGNLIYETLPQTRQLAYNVLQELGGYKKSLPTQAEFVSLSSPEINIEETKTGELIAEFKNTGEETWRGYEDNYLFITDPGIKNKLAKIDSYKIALASDKEEAAQNNTNQQIFKLLGGNIYPGQIGRFKLVLNPPIDRQTETKNFTLAWQDKGYFDKSDFSVTVNKIACQTCNQTASQNPIYQATLISSNFPGQIASETSAPVSISFQNSGNQPWEKNKLKLKIVYENTNISPFKNDSWYDEWASIIPKEEIIYPNSTANFEFKLKAPALLATFPHTLTLNYNDQTIYQLNNTIDVISSYAAQITANTLPQSAKRNSRPKVKLVFKNTGTKEWKIPTLKSYDIDYTNSWFVDWSWLDNKTIKKIKKTVKPGEEIEFNFRILSYWKSNTYPQLFKLFDGKNEVYLDSKKEFVIQTKVEK
jgi:uncharacterized protein with LGFP repeats